MYCSSNLVHASYQRRRGACVLFVCQKEAIVDMHRTELVAAARGTMEHHNTNAKMCFPTHRNGATYCRQQSIRIRTAFSNSSGASSFRIGISRHSRHLRHYSRHLAPLTALLEDVVFSVIHQNERRDGIRPLVFRSSKSSVRDRKISIT